MSYRQLSIVSRNHRCMSEDEKAARRVVFKHRNRVNLALENSKSSMSALRQMDSELSRSVAEELVEKSALIFQN